MAVFAVKPSSVGAGAYADEIRFIVEELDRLRPAVIALEMCRFRAEWFVVQELGLDALRQLKAVGDFGAFENTFTELLRGLGSGAAIQERPLEEEAVTEDLHDEVEVELEGFPLQQARRPALRRIILVSPPADGVLDGIAGAQKWAQAAEEALRQSGRRYAVVRPGLPRPPELLVTEVAEGEELVESRTAVRGPVQILPAGGGGADAEGGRISPVDLGEVIAALVVMDDVAEKADSRAGDPLAAFVRAAAGLPPDA